MTVNDIIKWRVTVICGSNEPQNLPHQPYYQTVTQMHLGISSVNRGTYHLAIYTEGQTFSILPFDWLVLSFFYVTLFYGFYGDLVFSSPPGYGLFQYILTRIRMSMTHRTFSNLLSGLRISLLFLISEFFLSTDGDEKKVN